MSESTPATNVSTSLSAEMLLRLWWDHRLRIIRVAGGLTVLAIIVSLVLPQYFRSTAVLLPETEKSKLSGMASLTELASIAGISVGGEGGLGKLYPTILRSEAVLGPVIYHEYQTKAFDRPVNLITFWDIDEATPERNFEMALKEMREELEVSFDIKTNVVTVSIETKEPQLSADIINTLVQRLDDFIRTKRTTNAGEQRKWIASRLTEVQTDLARAEDTLKFFRERNRITTGSPHLMLEEARLLREVQVHSTVYLELKKQFELAKIEEIKNIPIINVMDAARPAAKKVKPQRSLIVLGTAVLSTLGVLAWTVIMTLYGPKLRETWSLVRSILRRHPRPA